PSADAKYRFVWLYYDTAQRAEKQIFEQELTNQTEKDVVGKLSSTKDWPLGHYRVEIWVDGKRLAQRHMTIMTEKTIRAVPEPLRRALNRFKRQKEVRQSWQLRFLER